MGLTVAGPWTDTDMARAAVGHQAAVAVLPDFPVAVVAAAAAVAAQEL